jgi:hypothetical protein
MPSLEKQIKQFTAEAKNRPPSYTLPRVKPVYTGLPPGHPDALKVVGTKTIFEPCSQSQFESIYGSGVRRSDSDIARLVRGVKSPTPINPERKKQLIDEFTPSQLGLCTGSETVRFVEENDPKEIVANGTRLVISKREWSLEHRIRLESEVSVSQRPPEQFGERLTKNLTKRGIRTILDSGIFTGTHRGGFSTFATLTLDKKAREKVDTGELNPQKEMSRCLDAFQKMFQRGWVPEYKTEKSKMYGKHRIFCIEPNDNKLHCDYWQKSYPWGDVVSVGKSEYSSGLEHQKLDYMWVIEKPKNKQGEDNLHFHLLMRWDVPRKYFQAWAERIEKIWGHGYVHLERMRTKEASIDYLLKAIGYTTKAGEEESEQGEIRGNRYGISKTARAPEWEAVSSYEWGCMGYLFGMVQDRIAANRAQAANELKSARAKIGKIKKVKKNAGELHKARVRINLAKRDLEKVYKGKNVITMKGESVFSQFMKWAERQGYSKNIAPSRLWLSEFRRRLRVKVEYSIYKIKSFVCDHEWYSLFRNVKASDEPEPQSFIEYEGMIFNV